MPPHTAPAALSITAIQCAQVLREATTSAPLPSSLLGTVLVAVDPDRNPLSLGDTALQDTLNAHSDAWGWNSSSRGGKHHSTITSHTAQQRHQCWDSFVSKVEQDVQQRAVSTVAKLHTATGGKAQQRTLCLAVDSLSTLVIYYSVGKVNQQVASAMSVHSITFITWHGHAHPPCVSHDHSQRHSCRY